MCRSLAKIYPYLNRLGHLCSHAGLRDTQNSKLYSSPRLAACASPGPPSPLTLARVGTSVRDAFVRGVDDRKDLWGRKRDNPLLIYNRDLAQRGGGCLTLLASFLYVFPSSPLSLLAFYSPSKFSRRAPLSSLRVLIFKFRVANYRHHQV